MGRGKAREKCFNDRDALCPFFSAHGADYIRCEGMIPDTCVRIEFYKVYKERKAPDKKAKETQYRIFCCGDWRKCERADAIMRSKYDDDEG